MKILIIQTAFIGDVVLSTPLIGALRDWRPEADIDFLLRKGNEGLLEEHPDLRNVLVLDKKRKWRDMFRLLKTIRSEKYDHVINVQRHFTTGLLTVFSGAKYKTGFDKNPWSFLFTHTVPHKIGDSDRPHEVDRNLALVEHLTGPSKQKPSLYISAAVERSVAETEEYVCVAPASVWFTKQYPEEKWAELVAKIPNKYAVHLIGGPDDRELCEQIAKLSGRDQAVVYAGELSLIQSASKIKNARMTFTNDSAPMHLASAFNAPVTAIYCSTVPAFGFGPLSDHSVIVETQKDLDCRPCGLHGKKACPRGHFGCAEISVEDVLGKAGV